VTRAGAVGGLDVLGLKAHEVIPAPVMVLVRGETVGVPQPRPLQVVAHGPGIGEQRLFHPPHHPVPKHGLGLA
jgi:hypothetical protein